jgi:hypothetical protein
MPAGSVRAARRAVKQRFVRIMLAGSRRDLRQLVPRPFSMTSAGPELAETGTIQPRLEKHEWLFEIDGIPRVVWAPRHCGDILPVLPGPYAG